MQVDPNGDVRPCCMMTPVPTAIVGNINSHPLEVLWNSPNMKSLRANFLAGTRDSRCNICHTLDDAGLESFRATYQSHITKKFTGINNAIACTSVNGECDVFNLEYWDFRFSNFCNYKCRSCGPSHSSAWQTDAVKLGWANGPSTTQPITWLDSADHRVHMLEKHIDNVKEIYFAGGEPLLMEEHTRVLDLLFSNGRTDVTLRYNTNLSTLKYKHHDILADYWGKFDKVIISGSIDAIGTKAEYIRAGTKWGTVDKNIRRLVAASKVENSNISLSFNVTISTFNILYLEELVDYFISVGAIEDLNNYTSRPHTFWFNPVFSPKPMCIKNLPLDAKARVRYLFTDYDSRLAKKYDITYSFFTDLYPILDQDADPACIEEFKKMTLKLDAVRQETAETSIPEIWEYYK